MKILNIYRSEPNDLVKVLVDGMSKGETKIDVPLFKGTIDYAKLVNDIFASDRVICWW